MRVHTKGPMRWLRDVRLVGASAGHSGRRGLTLIELLAAMMVLIVGVYAVVALFPKLSRNIVEEERRTSMSRAVDRTAQRLQSLIEELPDAITPWFAKDPNGSFYLLNVNPASKPEDPDSGDQSLNPLNSRDDFICVFGEEILVPAPAAPANPADYDPSSPTPAGPSAYPCYVPKMGLVDPGIVPTVYELRPLTEAKTDPGASAALQDNEFYLRPDGQLRANPNPGAPSILVYYDWYDGATGLVLRQAGEAVMPGGYVQAAAGTVIPRSSQAYALYPWSCVVASPAPTTLPPGTRTCVLDPRAAQALYFPPSAAGARLKINYWLRREKRNLSEPDCTDPTDAITAWNTTTWRRALIMSEDKVLPNNTPYQIQLNFGNLESERPLLDDGNAATPDPYLLMVDLADGEPFTWDGTPTPLDAIADVDFITGIITLNVSNTSPLLGRLGNPVRIYYRTVDQDCVQVQKAPSEFVEVDPNVGSPIPDWTHRYYRVAIADPARRTVYLYGFPGYCQGYVIQVTYTVLPPGETTPRLISNEMQLIARLPNGSLGCILNEGNVVGVQSVRGATVKVSGWWRTETGRLSRYDLTNMLFPGV